MTGSAEAVGMPGGAAEDNPVCLVLGTASVTVIEKKKKVVNTLCEHTSKLEKIKKSEWLPLSLPWWTLGQTSRNRTIRAPHTPKQRDRTHRHRKSPNRFNDSHSDQLLPSPVVLLGKCREKRSHGTVKIVVQSSTRTCFFTGETGVTSQVAIHLWFHKNSSLFDSACNHRTCVSQLDCSLRVSVVRVCLCEPRVCMCVYARAFIIAD